MYFDNCNTADELKHEYRRCSKQLHPDRNGGDDRAFKEMQQEYERRLKKLITETNRNNDEINGELGELLALLLQWVKQRHPEWYAKIQPMIDNPISKLLIANNFIPEKVREIITKL